MKKNTYLDNARITEALMFSVLLLFSANAMSQQNIGRVIHASGKLVASNENGSRVLTRGSNITEGDVLNSGSTSMAQLRMMDGALISLRRNTEISFDKYQYKPEDSSASSSIFSLLRGGFNTISGLIGKQNKKNYRVNTPVATIGIRGTHYGVTLCKQGDCVGDPDEKIQDGLYASVIDGEISSENVAGYFVFSNDEYFFIADAGSAPRSLIKAPGVIFGIDAATEQQAIAAMSASTPALNGSYLQTSSALYTAANQNPATGNPSYQPVFASADDITSNTYMTPSQTGSAMIFSFFRGVPGALVPQSHTLIDDGTTNKQFALNAIAAADNLLIPTATRLTISGPTVRELYIANSTYNNDGSMTLAGTNIGWGRWTGNLYEATDDGINLSHTGTLHYVIADASTTPAQYGSITGNFAYTTAAGTLATDLYGNMATSAANINMGVTFIAGASQTLDSFTISTNVAGNTYAVDLNGIGGDGATAINTAINNGLILGQDATLCTSCNGTASLALVGSQAEGAITSYNIGNASASNTATGSAVLKR